MADIEGASYYIPVSRARVKKAVLAKEGLGANQVAGLGRICEMLEAIWHYRAHASQEELKSLYEEMDPDGQPAEKPTGVERFIEVFDKALGDGNWDLISQDELQEALDGEAVFPISLSVRFDEFTDMRLYKLGEHRFTDQRKAWFGLKKEEITVDAYDRVLQLVKYQGKDWFESNRRLRHYPGPHANGLHLHLFKTVPKLDLETIFPNTTPNMRILDRIKIIAPAVAGLVTLSAKFGPILFGNKAGSTSLSLILGILAGLGTYMLRAYLSYRKTKESYLAQVSQDLYFKGQANNSAVLNLVTDLSEEQEVKEAFLAYAFLLTEAGEKYDSGRLDDRIEEWIRETFDEVVDFEVDDALGKLEDLKLLNKAEDGTLSVVGIEDALRIMDDYWDNIFDYAN